MDDKQNELDFKDRRLLLGMALFLLFMIYLLVQDLLI